MKPQKQEAHMAESRAAGALNGRAQIPAPPEFQEDPPRPKPDADDDDAEGSVDPAHNKTERLKSLDAMLDEWCVLQDKEDRLLEKHIDPVRKKKADVKARAKADFDIPTEAFNARAALRRIERRSDNDEVVLAINELFEATPVGKNLDLVKVAERVAQKKAEAAAAEAAKKTKVRDGKEKDL